MGKKGLKLRPCLNCGELINFTFTELREGKRIFHWRNQSGEIHRCGWRWKDEQNHLQHIRSILQEDL